MEAGYKVVVEHSSQRAFNDQLYIDTGCEMAAEHSWQEAPTDNIIIGLKELSAELGPFKHQHVHFAHVYKEQEGWQQFLSEFSKGGGALFDLEYLVDENGRRIAAFGYWAGYVGAAVALLQWAAQQGNNQLEDLAPWASKNALTLEVNNAVQTALAAGAEKPDIMVIGAMGRSGGGAVELCEACNLRVTQWDQAETSAGGPFDEILQHHILVNCVFLNQPISPFTTLPHLQTTERKLSVISDVSCDPFSDANPLPIYSDCTSMKRPAIRVLEPNQSMPLPVDLISIDHLPTLLPVESSEEFCNALLPHLLAINETDKGVWYREFAGLRTAINR